MFKYPIISGDGGNSVPILGDPGAEATDGNWMWWRLVTKKKYSFSLSCDQITRSKVLKLHISGIYG